MVYGLCFDSISLFYSLCVWQSMRGSVQSITATLDPLPALWWTKINKFIGLWLVNHWSHNFNAFGQEIDLFWKAWLLYRLNGYNVVNVIIEHIIFQSEQMLAKCLKGLAFCSTVPFISTIHSYNISLMRCWHTMTHNCRSKPEYTSIYSQYNQHCITLPDFKCLPLSSDCHFQTHSHPSIPFPTTV